MCHNPMVNATKDGGTHVWFCGLWYRDKLVRTKGGWRISEPLPGFGDPGSE